MGGRQATTCELNWKGRATVRLSCYYGSTLEPLNVAHRTSSRRHHMNRSKAQLQRLHSEHLPNGSHFPNHALRAAKC